MNTENLYLSINDDDTNKNIGIGKNNLKSHTICFCALDGTEMLKLDLKTKDIFVKGELIENNQQVVDGLKEFLFCYF